MYIVLILILLLSCIVCRAFGLGGAVSFKVDAYDIGIYDCTFEDNAAYINGGALSFSQANTEISVVRSIFLNNFALSYGGCIYIGRFNEHVFLSSLTMHGGSADIGCGIAIDSINGNVVIEEVQLYNLFAASFGAGVFIGNRNIDIVLRDIRSNYGLAELYGGGIFINSQNSEISLEDILIVSSQALFGAGIYVNTRNGFVDFQDVVLEENLAEIEGGGLYINLRNWHLNFSNCVFRYNNAEISGGGVYMNTLNENTVFRNTIIESNKARDGGAIYLKSADLVLRIEHCLLSNNYASVLGGGIHMGEFSSELYITYSTFADNHCDGTGGAIFSLSPVIVTNSIFLRNTDVYGGGACHLANSKHDLKNITFVSNLNLNGAGGAILFRNPDNVRVKNSTFIQNWASSMGGGIAVLSDQTSFGGLRVNHSVFIQNGAGVYGGAIYVSTSSKNYINDCTFTDNYAGLRPSHNSSGTSRYLQLTNEGNGGGVYMASVQNSYLENSVFHHQSSALDGGSVMLSLCNSVHVIGNLIADSYTAAGSGSAAYVVRSREVEISGNRLIRNSAPFGGGSVFWEMDSLGDVVKYSTGLWYSNEFIENVASYGNDVATQIVRMNGSMTIDVVSYHSAVDSFRLKLLDFYDHVYNIDSSSIVIVEATNVHSCNGRSPGVGGSTFETVSYGEAVFNGLTLSCYPGGSVVLLFRAQVSDEEFKFTSTAFFRLCHIGEHIVDGACESCPLGFYSFDENAITSCKSCPSGTVSCYGSTIDLKPGFWRSDLRESRVHECPYGESACFGGVKAGNETCRPGYEGPLCAVCSDDYYFSSADQECLPCSASGLNIAGIVIIGIIAVVLFIPLCYLGLKWAFTSTAETFVTDFSVDTLAFSAFVIAYTSLVPGAEQRKEELEEMFNDLYARWWAQLKVFMSLIQIITALPVVTDVEFPPIFASLSKIMGQININIPASFGILCEASYDYMDVLAVTTLVPLCFWACLWAIYFFHYWYSRIIHQKPTSTIMATYGTYLWVYLFTSYMVLPGVAVYIFGTFSCHDINSDESYLRVDYSISCTSERYKSGTTWAAVMAAVYCVGVPFSYFILLHKRKETIKAREVPHTCSKMDLLKIVPLKFLFSAYEPQFWYWEVIETYRRLILTGVLVLVSQGDPLQLVIGMVLAVFFIKLYAYYSECVYLDY